MNGTADTLSDQIRRKILMQKAVGHDTAAVVTYEELNEWVAKSDELIRFYKDNRKNET